MARSSRFAPRARRQMSLAGLLLVLARPAHADPTVPPPVVTAPVVADTAPLRLHDLIADEAEIEHRQRVAAAALTFTLAGAAAGSGIACFAAQPSPNNATAWTGAGIGFEAVAGLGVLFGALSLAIPTSMEKLATDYKPIAHGTAPDRLAWGEDRLAALARAEKSARTRSAIVSIALSPVVLGLGITSAMLLPPGTDDGVRAGYAAIFGLLGFADAAIGVIRLLSVDPAERLLRTWRVGTGRPAEAHLWASPLRNGGAAGLSMTF